MNTFKKIIFLMIVATINGTSFGGVLSAQDYYNGGYAYEGSRRASSVSPLVVIGTIAAATAIVVLISNGDTHNHFKGHHHHSHAH